MTAIRQKTIKHKARVGGYRAGERHGTTARPIEPVASLLGEEVTSVCKLFHIVRTKRKLGEEIMKILLANISLHDFPQRAKKTIRLQRSPTTAKLRQSVNVRLGASRQHQRQIKCQNAPRRRRRRRRRCSQGGVA